MNSHDSVQSLRIGELDYAIRDTGDPNGRPIVLLHGLMDTGASFEPLVEAMQALAPGRYRYIAPDWRGHGDSDAIHDSYWFPTYLLDLERLLNELIDGDTPVTLIAHSMGGQVASLYAGTRPARVSNLVTLDSLNVPDSDTREVPSRYRRWLDAHATPPGAKVYDDIETAASRIAARYPELDESTIRRLAEQWTAAADPQGRRRMRVDPWHRVPLPYAFRAAEAKSLWREVSARVLCIDGGDSPAKYFCGEAEMAERRACFTDLRHIVVDGCGHMLHLQKPQAIARHICTFLDA